MRRRKPVQWEFGLKCGEERVYQTAYKRLDTASTTEVLGWSLRATNSAYAALEEWTKAKDPAVLKDAREGILALLAAVTVLETRV